MADLSSVPFVAGWRSFGLRRYRACNSTYCLFSYDTLPPLAPADETFDWLTPLSAQLSSPTSAGLNAAEAREHVEALAADVAGHGLRLPASFTRLMSTPELQDRIPSCTACEFDLDERLIACPESKDGFIVPFLHDQQGSVVWYLYLTPSGDHCVLAHHGVFQPNMGRIGGADIEKAMAKFRACAPTFTDFIHRFWLENVLWFKLYRRYHQPLTTEEQAYLDHYARLNGQP